MKGQTLTSDMDTFSEYDIVNYCEGGASTAVTSGEGRKLKTFVHYKDEQSGIPDDDICAFIKGL